MKIIEICAVKGLPKKKNGFYWHVVVKAKKDIGNPKKKGNVKYAGHGINNLSNTKRAAINHNKDLITKLPIYNRGKLI